VFEKPAHPDALFTDHGGRPGELILKHIQRHINIRITRVQSTHANMLIISPSAMLAKLTPMKSLLCIVRRSPSAFGMAISDPYLHHASPLQDVSDERDVENTIAEHGVGALLLALPMARTDKSTRDYANVMYQRTSLLQHKWNVPLACISDERLSWDEARLSIKQEVEMWEEVDLDCPDLSTDAAVALNRFLWTHTGGWQNNTFG
jgi:RNase H-fold protein (predicted Holliday junction resolvase)